MTLSMAWWVVVTAIRVYVAVVGVVVDCGGRAV